MANKPLFWQRNHNNNKQGLLRIPTKKMGFFDAIGDTAKRAKLTGEIALLDREMTTRKKSFGVELYDIISKQQKINMKNDMFLLEAPPIFKTVENEIQEPLDKYSKEIRVMELELKTIEDQIELQEAKKIRDAHSTTSSGVGQSMKTKAKDAELYVKIKYLKREMLLRKEQFGLEVWDAAAGPSWLHEAVINETKDKSGLGMVTGTVGGLVKGVKGTVTKTLGAMSSDEREIATCVNKAKDDIKKIDDQKRQKEKEVAMIVNKNK